MLKSIIDINYLFYIITYNLSILWYKNIIGINYLFSFFQGSYEVSSEGLSPRFADKEIDAQGHTVS